MGHEDQLRDEVEIVTGNVGEAVGHEDQLRDEVEIVRECWRGSGA